MSKHKIKEDLLKMLRDEMMEEDREESMESAMGSLRHPKKIQATISGDTKEDIIKGAKALPEALSKAEEFMKMRMGDKKSK
jgi:hypothetical protein